MFSLPTLRCHYYPHIGAVSYCISPLPQARCTEYCKNTVWSSSSESSEVFYHFPLFICVLRYRTKLTYQNNTPSVKICIYPYLNRSNCVSKRHWSVTHLGGGWNTHVPHAHIRWLAKLTSSSDYSSPWTGTTRSSASWGAICILLMLRQSRVMCKRRECLMSCRIRDKLPMITMFQGKRSLDGQVPQPLMPRLQSITRVWSQWALYCMVGNAYVKLIPDICSIPTMTAPVQNAGKTCQKSIRQRRGGFLMKLAYLWHFVATGSFFYLLTWFKVVKGMICLLRRFSSQF